MVAGEPASEGVPTIYTVATRAGVSIATVSRVLNGHSQIRPETERRVLEAVRELGFVPNAAAQGLSKGLKRILGLVFANPWWQDDEVSVEDTHLLFADTVIRGAQWRADQQGYSLLLLSAGNSGPRSSSFGDFIGKVDGLILLDRVVDNERVGTITDRVPVVLLAGSGRARNAVTVRVDNERGVRAVVEHLVALHGLTRLAFVSGLPDSPDNDARQSAFEAAARELGASFEPVGSLGADWTSSGAVEAMTRRLDEKERPLPEALVCANDQMAVGAMHALVNAGIAIPDEVAVVGFDDIPVARYLSPPLTTVRQPMKDLGAAAVDALVDQLQRRRIAARDIVLPTELVVRGSCGCQPDSRSMVTELEQVTLETAGA